MRWVGHVAHMWERRVVCGVCMGKPEGKRPLGRPGHRWEDNIKMRSLRSGVGGAWTGSICLGIGQVVASCKHCNEPSDCIKCGEFLD
jgi:hypothetical protein